MAYHLLHLLHRFQLPILVDRGGDRLSAEHPLSPCVIARGLFREGRQSLTGIRIMGGGATRLTRELCERGNRVAYTAVKRGVAAIWPSDGPKPFEERFETPSGH